MKIRKSGFFFSVMTLILVLVITGCGGEKPEPEQEEIGNQSEEQQKEKLKVALLLDGNIKDGGWNQLPYEGLMKAAEDFGIVGDYTEMIPQNEIMAVMRDYANKGYKLIIANGYTFADALLQVSEEYPEIMFIGTNVPTAGPNLATARIVYGINGYLAAPLMAEMTKTKKVGYVCAVQSPQMDSEIGNMEAKLQELDPEIQLKGVYTGDWSDVNKAKQAASSLADEGIDIIINNIDGATAAIAQMAKEKGIYVVGWAGDEAKLDPDTILTSLIIRNDIVVYSAIEQVLNGGYTPGKSIQMGLETKALGFGEFGNAPPQELKDKLLAEQEKVQNGEITINTAVEGWD